MTKGGDCDENTTDKFSQAVKNAHDMNLITDLPRRDVGLGLSSPRPSPRRDPQGPEGRPGDCRGVTAAGRAPAHQQGLEVSQRHGSGWRSVQGCCSLADSAACEGRVASAGEGNGDTRLIGSV